MRPARTARMIPVLMVVCLLTLPAPAQYSGGSGTADDPYQIATATDLIALGETPDEYDKHFILTADINLDPNLPGRRVFDRAVIAWDTDSGKLAFQGTSFTGVFDGNGHTISHLTIEGGGYLGLFGKSGSGAEIKNTGVVNVDITGADWYAGALVGVSKSAVSRCSAAGAISGKNGTGGLMGLSQGSVSQCYSTCIVSGNSYVGGLVGYNNGPLTHCYSTGTVNGDTRVGGLVGYNDDYAHVASSYSTGIVNGDSEVGGLVGENHRGSITSSFWDIETSAQTTSAGGEPKTTSEMQTASTFLAWRCEPTLWTINEGVDHPRLAWEDKAGNPLTALSEFLQGSGTQLAPYLIYSASELSMIGLFPCEWGKHFKLMADIDLSGHSYDQAVIAADVDPCEPGFQTTPFTGVFDGNSHTISHLTIDGMDYLGLFGQLENGGVVKNLAIVDVNIIGSGENIGSVVGLNGGDVCNCYPTGSVCGRHGVGGLAGRNTGSIALSYSNCKVTAESRVGGLVGSNYSDDKIGRSSGNITTSCSTGTLSGDWAVGGLVGVNHRRARIATCYSSGMVRGNADVGGLVGYNYLNLDGQGTITTCYSTGIVNGTGDSVGGLVGGGGGPVTRSFWDVETSGQAISGGGTGKIMAEMQTASTFYAWACGDELIWTIDEGNDYPRLW